MFLVSVIVPIYNSKKYLKRCLDSLINQSWPNCEFILVDNGSQDNSIEIISEYARRYEKIKIFNCEIKGAAAARNYGIEKASGDYLLFLDSDDYVDENYVKDMILKVSNKESTMVLCNTTELWKQGKTERILFKGINDKEINKADVIREIACGNAGLVCCKLIQTKVVKENKINFDTNIKLSEDLIFFLKVAQLTDKFYFVNESLYFYDRRNENSITNIYINDYWENQIYVFERIENTFNQLNLFSDNDKIILDNKIKNALFFSIKNEFDNLPLTKSIINVEKILNNNRLVKKYNNKAKNSYMDKILIKASSKKCKGIWTVFLAFIFKIIYPLKVK